MNTKAKLFRISYKITIMVICVIMISTAAIGVLSYVNYRNHTIELLSDNLLAVARSAATLIDPSQYRETMASMEANDYHDWLTAQFTKIVYEHDIFFLHAGEIDPDIGFTGFVEAQIPGFGTGLGEVTPAYQYPSEAFDAMARGNAYVGAPVNAEDFGIQIHGAIIIGAYAPVFDENGNPIAIVSATLMDTGVYASSNEFALRMLGMALLITFILIWVPIIFTRRMIRIPISKLSAATNAIIHGDLSGELNIESNDEFGILSNNFTMMQTSIRQKREVEKAAHQAELARGQAEAVAETMRASIVYASKIQRNLLPEDSVFQATFSDYAVIWKPRDIVGGDIYWMKQFDKGTALCVADCTGHGTPGALLTMLVVADLGSVVRTSNCDDTAGIVYQLDKRLATSLNVKAKFNMMDINDGCDIAVLFISKDGSVKFSAGNTNVFICNGKEVTRHRGQKIFVGEGKLKSKDEVEVINVPADPDNKFYIASDGLYEQPGGACGRAYGVKKFSQILMEHHHEKQAAISGKAWAAFEEYRGAHPRVDDFNLVCFQPKKEDNL